MSDRLMSEMDRAFIAGLIEGRGRVEIRHATNTRGSYDQIRLCFDKLGAETIEWLRAKIPALKVESATRPQRCYLLSFHASALFVEAHPYLHDKKAHAKLVWKWVRTFPLKGIALTEESRALRAEVEKQLALLREGVSCSA